MNILKHIRLALVLIPAGLMGMEGSSNNWIKVALTSKKSGSWLAVDKNGKTVLIEGELISPNGKIISSDFDNLSNMLADVMLEPVTEVTQASIPAWFVSKLKNLYFWRSNRNRLYDAYVDEIKTLLTPECKNLAYIFTVNELLPDDKKKLLGSVMFIIDHDYEYGTVNLDNFVIKPEARNRGLSKLLASSIFKVLPQVKRIILDTLYTNIKAQTAYKSYGFKKFGNYDLFGYEFAYEYLTDTCTKLQDVAAQFKDV